MPVFQVQDLIDRAAALADMHDNFVTPAQWIAWYNDERRALQLFMARHSAVMQNISLTTLPPPNDVVTTVGEMIALVGVWEQLSNGRMRPLKIVNFPDNFMQGAGGPTTGPAQIVSLTDSNSTSASSFTLRFYPRDPSGTYVMGTVDFPATAVAATDTTSLPMGLEKRIVLGMARQALIKEESDTEKIDDLIKEQDRHTEEYIWTRLMAQSPSVRNVDRVQRGWGVLDFTFPSPDFWIWV